MQPSHQKLIVILGPTSSGKSDYAIKLAKEIDGEVISVDSRQVYRGMDIGTGKVTRDEKGSGTFFSESKKRYLTPYFSEGIRHHLLDVASPKREYNVTHFLRDARKAIADIEKRGKTPIIAGGTHFWIEALLFNTVFPEVKPNPILRKRLGTLSATELFAILEKRDPERAATIDAHNKVRLIRALEIIESLGKVPAIKGDDKGVRYLFCRTKKVPDPLQSRLTPYKVIALNPPKDILHTRIEKRLKERLDQGMIDEVKRLHNEGVSWKRLEGFGLEYRWCAQFLQEKVSREEMEQNLLIDSKHYAKRQLSSLRRLEKHGIKIERKISN